MNSQPNLGQTIQS